MDVFLGKYFVYSEGKKKLNHVYQSQTDLSKGNHNSH